MKKSMKKRVLSGLLAVSCGAAAVPAFAVNAEDALEGVTYSLCDITFRRRRYFCMVNQRRK